MDKLHYCSDGKDKFPNQGARHFGVQKKFLGTPGHFLKTGRSREKRDEWKIYVRITKYNIHRPQGEVVILRFSSRCVRHNNAINKLPSKQPVIVNLIWQHVLT